MDKLNLDLLLNQIEDIRTEDILTEDIQSEVPVLKIDLDSILHEWCFRCDKGYPELDDVSDMWHLQNILSERNIENPFPLITETPKKSAIKPVVEPMPELPRPITGTNDTSLKEGLVCLFFDCFKDNSLRTKIIELQSLKRSKIGRGLNIQKNPYLDVTCKSISKIFRANLSNYGFEKSAVQNLDEYISWVWLTGYELDTLNNALSAANAIIKNVTSTGQIIRNQSFDNIRDLASKLIKDEYNITLLPDNWCPGDVYIIKDSASVATALSAKSLNVDPKNNLNSNFGKSLNKARIIAISLKEEKAQAGKASTFNENVFKKTYTANVDKKDSLGTSSNKDTVKVAASIQRYLDYMNGNPKSKRIKNYINAIVKQGKIHNSVNTILAAAGFPTIKSKNIKMSNDENAFYKENKSIFDNLNAAIPILKGKFKDEQHVKDTLKHFVNSRNQFLLQIKELNVEVSSKKSATFAAEIEKTVKDDSTKVFSMKAATYELASLVINKWKTDVENISPAYKKISTTTNPFVALTAYAIAEAGISPSFWKVIGSERGIDGHASYFDSNDVVDIDTKTMPIVLIDSPGQAGFYLKYITLVGSKKYQTILTFRFASDTIRIEVEKLKEL
jgi:hypothetical protein